MTHTPAPLFQVLHRPKGKAMHTINQDTLDSVRRALINANTAYYWGDVSDYYTDASEVERKRAAFDADAAEWEDAWTEAHAALPALANAPVDLSPVADAIELAARIEGRWGDDPATQIVCHKLAAALGWEITRPADLPDMLRSGDAQ